MTVGCDTMFNERRTAQVAARFLQLGGGTMAVLKLMKLMYLADRESLRRFGRPITFDYMVAMDHGPVLSQTLNLANGTIESEADGWERWISDRADYEVELREVPTREMLDELSDVDLEVVNDVWGQLGHLSKWQIRDWTHANCGEWQDPHGSSTPISLEAVLEQLGRSEEEADAIAAELRARSRIERRLAVGQ